MYITYCRNQKSVDVEDKTSYRLGVTGGEYRPTWLVRVSDWTKVPGKEAVDGYHTISYCWEQSGEVVRNETDNEYSLFDHGKHCIVEGYNLYQDDILPLGDFVGTEDDDQEDCKKDNRDENTEHNSEDDNEISDEDNGNGEKNDQDEQDEEYGLEDDCAVVEKEESNNYNEYVTWCEPKSESTSIRYVTYDQLLQQVCQDFQVEYVWYDKVCIDQADNQAKSHEIKQMHRIYRNACYTIVMVPEVRLYNPDDFEHEIFGCGNEAQDYVTDDVWNSCWFKRSWTLEEVMMARRILIVGTNTNMFQHSLHSNDVPTTIDVFSGTLLDFGGTEQNKGSVNQALAFAHFRTSTKPHDMIYALKNTLSDIFGDMEVSYSTDIKTVFNDFYRHVATDDLSILCFGSNRRLNGSIGSESTMDDYDLPSWTGVAGRHIDNRAITTPHPQLEYYIDETMLLHVTTKEYWKIFVTSYDRGCYSSSNSTGEENDFCLKEMDRILSARYDDKWTDMTTADKDTVLMEWFVNMNGGTSLHMTHYHPRRGDLLTDIRPLTLTEDCEECIIIPILLELQVALNEQAGDNESNFIIRGYEQRYCLPVLRKCTEGSGRYRAIGVYYVGDRDFGWQPSIGLNHFIGRDDINLDDPEEIISVLFENDCHDVSKEFIIE
ncbi:hypothetical protein INT45_003608 [Circinella minor]|uniref:Heterokaryon incompatibility domain-containing protein n=1 Tax=Circinella minor TaxID=1195481 RepID=A0A8H7VGM6_9FUNG|nr:hypothetical protein INT45_003608 [Circinella minor]